MASPVSRSLVGQLADVILDGGYKRATKYLSEKLTVKATYQGRRTARTRSHTVVFTIGRPNYAERRFIRACRSAGEPFPVKRLQVTR